jgi:zinc protease
MAWQDARLTRAILAIAVLLAAAACASPRPSRGTGDSDSSPPPERHVLSNDVRVVLQEHRASDIVAIHLWAAVGGRDEAPSERGFSHFAEHMLFKGTGALGVGFVDREVEAVGGRTNAGTSWDYTFYYLLLPASRVERGISVVAGMAYDAAFEPAEIEREREVVFEEIRLGQDNQRRFLNRRLFELAFRGHPYGLPVLGDPAALRGATRESLRGYYRQRYVPRNLTVVIVGAIDTTAVLRAVSRAFGAEPARAAARPAVAAPAPLDGSERLAIERPEREAALGLAWRAPALGEADMYAIDITAHILGGARSSRLNQALRERQGLVSSIQSGYTALQGAGLITVTAELAAGSIDRAEEAALAEIARLAEHGVSERELRRAITAAEAQHVFATETAEGRAYSYGSAETLWSLDGELRFLQRIRAVTAADVQTVARRYLRGAHARLALVPRGTRP